MSRLIDGLLLPNKKREKKKVNPIIRVKIREKRLENYIIILLLLLLLLRFIYKAITG
jgi:hypothetical protein